MRQTFGIDSDTGGVVITAPGMMPAFDDDFAADLNVVFDPMGTTCAALDFPGESWSEVWPRAVSSLQSRGDSQVFHVIVARSGLIFVRVQDEPLTPEETASIAQSFTSSVQVPNGQNALLALDGMHFFDAPDPSDEDEGPVLSNYDFEEIPLAPGSYTLTIHVMQWHNASQTVGIFGTDELPAIIAVISPSANDNQPTASVSLVDCDAWICQPVAGAYCNAIVNGYTSGEGSASLFLTSHVSSGTARFPAGTYRPEPDESVLLKLIANRGSYWTAKLVEDKPDD